MILISESAPVAQFFAMKPLDSTQLSNFKAGDKVYMNSRKLKALEAFIPPPPKNPYVHVVEVDVSCCE